MPKSSAAIVRYAVDYKQRDQSAPDTAVVHLTDLSKILGTLCENEMNAGEDHHGSGSDLRRAITRFRLQRGYKFTRAGVAVFRRFSQRAL